MELTLWIAAYGAVLSSIVFGWNLYRDLTDRGRLDVSPSVVQIVNVPGTVPDNPDWKLHLRVTNTGRRQVWITNIGGRMTTDEGFVLVARNRLPMKLEPGQLIDEAPPADEISDPKKVAFFSAEDSTGRQYRSPVRLTWQTVSDLLDAQGKEADLSWGFRMRNLWARLRIRVHGWIS